MDRRVAWAKGKRSTYTCTFLFVEPIFKLGICAVLLFQRNFFEWKNEGQYLMGIIFLFFIFLLNNNNKKGSIKNLSCIYFPKLSNFSYTYTTSSHWLRFLYMFLNSFLVTIPPMMMMNDGWMWTRKFQNVGQMDESECKLGKIKKSGK
jgi:hypothetical protein